MILTVYCETSGAIWVLIIKYNRVFHSRDKPHTRVVPVIATVVKHT